MTFNKASKISWIRVIGVLFSLVFLVVHLVSMLHGVPDRLIYVAFNGLTAWIFYYFGKQKGEWLWL